jgi:hypothetical protein
MYKDPPLAESLPFAQHPLPVLVDPPMCQRQSSPAAKLGSTRQATGACSARGQCRSRATTVTRFLNADIAP